MFDQLRGFRDVGGLVRSCVFWLPHRNMSRNPCKTAGSSPSLAGTYCGVGGTYCGVRGTYRGELDKSIQHAGKPHREESVDVVRRSRHRVRRRLAERTGQSFTWPKTFNQASAEIDRLKQAQPGTRLDTRLIDREIADAIACGDADATPGAELGSLWPRCQFRPHGRTTANRTPLLQPARWTAARCRRLGQRTELARYTVAGGERVLYGQRVDGVVRFLPGDPVVLDGVRADGEDDMCRSRGCSVTGGRAHAVRQKRPHAEVPPANAGEAS